MSEPDFLTVDVTGAIVGHMNAEHLDDCVQICRGLGGVADVRSATVVDLDSHGVRLAAVTGSGSVVVTLPWSEPVASRQDVRRELVRMVEASTST